MSLVGLRPILSMGITASAPLAPAGASPLATAASRGDVATVASLLASGDHADEPDGAVAAYRRAAAAAASGGHLCIIQLLHDRGLLEVSGQEAMALGAHAIKRGDESVIDWLDSVAGDDWVSTPVSESDFKRLLAEPLLACPPRSPVVARVLARLGRERLGSLQGWILIESACTRPRVSAARVRAMLAAGCPLSLGRHSLITTLCVAISSAASAASDGSSGDEGCTALREVLCAVVRSAAGRAVLRNPACSETHGWLANHLPGLGDPADLLPLLVQAGLDLNLPDSDGQTAAHWAVLALQGHGGTRFAVAPQRGRGGVAAATAASASADAGREDALVLPRARRLLHFIASSGGDLDHADTEGHSPLSRALALYCAAHEPRHRSEADALLNELLRLGASPLSAGGALRFAPDAPADAVPLASRPPAAAAAALLQGGICDYAWRRRRHVVLARAVAMDPDRYERCNAPAPAGAASLKPSAASAPLADVAASDASPAAASCLMQ